MKAIWNGVVLAESDETVMVEGNHYFPEDSLNDEYFQENTIHTVCGWKGTASYYDIEVNGQTNHSGAWFYPRTSNDAKKIEGYVAFWRGIQVTA